MQAFMEWRFSTREGFQAHGPDDVSSLQCIIQTTNSVYGESQYELRSVDQCQSFFRTKFQWSKSKFLQHLEGIKFRSLIHHFSKTYQRQKQVSQWSQVA